MNWYDAEYKKKLTTPQKAVERIKNGATIIHGVTLTEPPALLTAIAERARAGDLKKIKIYSFNPSMHAEKSYFSVDLFDCIETYSCFISKTARNQASVGLCQYIPSYLHQVPKFIQENMTVDVSVTTVSLMDNAGFFSLGLANPFTSIAARQSKMFIVEVNKNMPRVFGDSLVHVSEVEAIVENHVPCMDIPLPEPKPEDEIIGKKRVELISDGVVFQLGIGTLPNAICPYLTRHKDMGIHTELLGPGMIELIKKGVITGRRKTLHPRKHIFSVCYGRKDTFDFMKDNPSMGLYPSFFFLG